MFQKVLTVVAFKLAPLILNWPPLFVTPYLPYKNEIFQKIVFFLDRRSSITSRLYEETHEMGEVVYEIDLLIGIKNWK